MLVVLVKVLSMMSIPEEIGTIPSKFIPQSKIISSFISSVALAIASGRIELPVQSSTYPSLIIDTMLSMLDIEPDRRPSIDEVITQLSQASRLTMDIA